MGRPAKNVRISQIHTYPLHAMQINNEMTKLRKIDAHTVYRYAKAIRAGATFPPIVLDGATHAVISGNHRLAAYQMELDPESDIVVKCCSFKSKADRIKYFVEDNAKHGLPLDSFSQKKVIQALINEDVSHKEIAVLLQVEERNIEKIAGQTMVVIGDTGETQYLPIKAGPDLEPGSVISKEDYDIHEQRDMGITAKNMAEQLVRWLDKGWIDFSKGGNAEALYSLQEALKKSLP